MSIDWASIVRSRRNATVNHLWLAWLTRPEDWNGFIHEVDTTFGPGITEDLYNYHDDWEREQEASDE